ncbi:LANO_0G00738g1_1 [Lachancea nothofagi CBS 11611]|uniref:LANO_0G00738g1_1 n=1 Tax=Lachancea nothofagi CBS 11611 TaxID=1266666 RepID=A0A1G4KEI5_9SACH|nr:LANO_0G00738g1_1 [Lachancea nothofagi CBS 11611]
MRLVLTKSNNTESTTQPAHHRPKLMHLLLVNPNSTESMTQAAGQQVEAYLNKAYPGNFRDIEVSLFTGPPDAPPEIDGEKTSYESARKCLPLLCERTLDTQRKQYFDTFDGVLVACFSDHPLVHQLLAKTESSTPVTGIFHASMTTCLSRPGAAFSIITSNDEWVELLDAGAEKLLGAPRPYAGSCCSFKGTIASSLPVLDLHNPKNLHAIAKRIYQENVRRLNTTTVILGCAGFSGMEQPLQQEIRNIALEHDSSSQLNVTLLDSVVCGIETLALMCRLQFN